MNAQFQVRSTRPARNLRHRTDQLMHRMLSPICGLSTSIGFTMRPSGGPRVMTAGGDMTGVHVLNGTDKPRRGFYHIGGSGVTLEEAVIRTLGETAERYSQFVSPRKFAHRLRWCSWEQLSAEGVNVLEPNRLRLFAEHQYQADGFPYHPFSPGKPISWIEMPSLLGNRSTWVPTQLVLVGYVVRDDLGEPWLTSAVTTGSAAHTEPVAALRNALLELIQVDAAMGHWYSGSTAPRIGHDSRTRRIDAFIRRYFSRNHGPRPEFYAVRSADLPAHNVACVLRDERATPRVGVGLGSDTTLEGAMYSALLEGIGVFHLAKINLLEARKEGTTADTAKLFDLDQNVAWHSLPENRGKLEKRYLENETVAASELPPDDTRPLPQQVARLIRAFGETNKELLFLDLTSTDLKQLGLTAVRAWSPQLLGLVFPSAPQQNHSRFSAYGGFSNVAGPHPYP